VAAGRSVGFTTGVESFPEVYPNCKLVSGVVVLVLHRHLFFFSTRVISLGNWEVLAPTVLYCRCGLPGGRYWDSSRLARESFGTASNGLGLWLVVRIDVAATNARRPGVGVGSAGNLREWRHLPLKCGMGHCSRPNP